MTKMANFIKKNPRMTLQETDDFVLLVGESISVLPMGAILSNLEFELLMFLAREFESFAQVSVNASLHLQ